MLVVDWFMTEDRLGNGEGRDVGGRKIGGRERRRG